MSEIIDTIFNLQFTAESESVKKAAANISSLNKEVEKLTDETKDYQQFLQSSQPKSTKLEQEAIAAVQKNTVAIKQKKQAIVAETLANSDLNKEIVKELGLLASLNAKLDALKAKKAFASTPAELKAINVEIAKVNAQMKSSGEAASNGLTKAFSGLRSLAYILPGIGIAGIFNLAFEAIGRLFPQIEKFTKELFGVSGAQKDLNEAIKDGIKSSFVEVSNLDRLYKKTQDVTLSIEERGRAVDKLQKLFPAYFKDISDEIILNGGAKDSYDLLRASIIATAKAKAIEGKIGEIVSDDLDKELQLRKDLTKATIEERKERGKEGKGTAFVGGSSIAGTATTPIVIDAQTADALRTQRKAIAKKALQDFQEDQADRLRVLTDALDIEDKQIDDRTVKEKAKKEKRTKDAMKDDSLKIQLDANDKRFESNLQLMKKISEVESENNKKIIADEKNALNERLKANEGYYANKVNLIDLDETKEIRAIESQGKEIEFKITEIRKKIASKNTSAADRTIYQNELKAELYALEVNEQLKNAAVQKSTTERNDLIKDGEQAKLEIIRKYNEMLIKLQIAGLEYEKEKYDEYTLEALRELDSQFNKKEIKYKAYQKRRDYITEAANLNSLEAQLSYAEKLLEIENLTAEQRLAISRKVAALRQQIEAQKAQITISQQGDAKKKLDEQIQYYRLFAETVSDILSTINDAQIKAVDKEINAQLGRIERAKKYAERGGAELLEIEEERLAKLEEKREQYAQRQLRINSVLALSNAIVAVTAAAAEGGVVLVGAILAAIAAGYGVVASFQEPLNFAEGTKSVEGPGTETSDSVPANLSRGERVIPARRSRDFKPVLDDIQDGKFKSLDDLYSQIRTGQYSYGMNYAGAIESRTGGNNFSNADVVAAIGGLKEAIENKPVASMTADENGLSLFITRYQQRIQKRNKY